jgi:hypothetical protein
MSAINLGVGCCIPGVVCTLSSWKTAEFSNTTNFHCCINGSSADQCYIYAYIHLHKLQVLVWYRLLNIPARSWYWVYYIKQYPPGPGIKSFSKLSFWLDHHIGFIRGSTQTLSMWHYKSISHITVLDTNFFPIPPIKLKLGLQADERLLIATHLDQSNYLAKQKQGTVNK